MYKCDDCGATFRKPDTEEFCYEEEYGYVDGDRSRHFGLVLICPECGSKWIGEVKDERVDTL